MNYTVSIEIALPRESENKYRFSGLLMRIVGS